MGTYLDSRIVKARKPHVCSRCGEPINPGGPRSIYLRYQIGQRSCMPVCMRCAVERISDRGDLRFDCAAMRDRLGIPQNKTRG